MPVPPQREGCSPSRARTRARPGPGIGMPVPLNAKGCGRPAAPHAPARRWSSESVCVSSPSTRKGAARPARTPRTRSRRTVLPISICQFPLNATRVQPDQPHPHPRMPAAVLGIGMPDAWHPQRWTRLPSTDEGELAYRIGMTYRGTSSATGHDAAGIPPSVQRHRWCSPTHRTRDRRTRTCTRAGTGTVFSESVCQFRLNANQRCGPEAWHPQRWTRLPSTDEGELAYRIGMTSAGQVPPQDRMSRAQRHAQNDRNASRTSTVERDSQERRRAECRRHGRPSAIRMWRPDQSDVAVPIRMPRAIPWK